MGLRAEGELGNMAYGFERKWREQREKYETLIRWTPMIHNSKENMVEANSRVPSFAGEGFQ